MTELNRNLQTTDGSKSMDGRGMGIWVASSWGRPFQTLSAPD
jgi:hypothetical protein